MSEKALGDNREIARHNEMKILVVLGKLNNEPLHIARIIREGTRIQSLKEWKIDDATIPGIRSALKRLEKRGILRSYMSKSEIRHRETRLYRIVPTLDAFSEIANNYGLSVVSFIRSSKFGQLVLVNDTPAYVGKKLNIGEDAMEGCSDLLKDIVLLAQTSPRALEVLLYPALTFDRELPRAGPERIRAILTYLRDVMNLAFAFDMAVSPRKKLQEEGMTAEITLSTMATIENKQVEIVSNIRTDKATEKRS
jgi:hypothetical protein